MRKPLVSAVITTLNSDKTLGKLLTSIKGQSYHPVEIIVVDNNSTDETLKVAKNFTDKVFTKGPERSFGDGFWAKAKILEREIHQGENYFEAARFFPQKLFWEFGGYDETLTGPEDWDLPQRLAKKHRVGRIKSFILHNEGCPTLFKLAKRKYYYGLSAHQYLKKI